MANPVALFGEIPKEIEEKVIKLRKEIRTLGYDLGEQYLNTLPHLTLAVAMNFDRNVDDVKSAVEKFTENLSPFSLKVEDFIFIDNNIAVKFNNSYTKDLATKLGDDLKIFGFEPIVTDFMKIIRSEVKPEFQEKVIRMLKERIPAELPIVKISLAGKELRTEDILWSINLKS